MQTLFTSCLSWPFPTCPWLQPSLSVLTGNLKHQGFLPRVAHWNHCGTNSCILTQIGFPTDTHFARCFFVTLPDTFVTTWWGACPAGLRAFLSSWHHLAPSIALNPVVFQEKNILTAQKNGTSGGLGSSKAGEHPKQMDWLLPAPSLTSAPGLTSGV